LDYNVWASNIIKSDPLDYSPIWFVIIRMFGSIKRFSLYICDCRISE